MTTEERSIQTRVGVFAFIGIAFIALMVVYFGRFGEGIQHYYQLRVEFPNASGLLRGSEIFMAGAKIGRVADNPKLLPNMQGVYVELNIMDNVKIPSASEVSIGSSGLLGDRFVQIVPAKDGADSPPLEPGSHIKGKSDTGFENITKQAEILISDLQTAVRNINGAILRIDSTVLSDKGLRDFTNTMSNLSKTSVSISEAAKKVDKIVVEASLALKGSKQTMDSAKLAAEEFQETMSEVRSLVKDVRSGRGVLGMLLTNQEVANNFRAMVLNLRRHGIIWYRNDAKQ